MGRIISPEEKLKILKLAKLQTLKETYRNYTPNERLEQYINAFGSDDYFITYLSAANGIGKCVRLTHPVLMADGTYKELGKVRTGERVMAYDTKTQSALPTKVLQTSRAGMKDVYRFNFKDGGHIEASPEHSFPVKIRSGRKSRIVKKTVQELLDYKQSYVGGSIKFQSPKSVDFKNNTLLPIHPYLLGMLLGDGHLGKETVRLTMSDARTVDRVKKIVSGIGMSVKKIKNRDYDYILIKTHGKTNPLLRALGRLGLVSTKSHNKFVPEVYKTCDIESRKQLVAGLIDSDGTFNEYLTKSPQLASDLDFLVKSLGGRSIIKTRTVNNDFTKGRTSLFYRVYWRFDYKLPLAISEKQRVSKKPVEYSNRFVKNVEYLGKFECGDIFIDHPDHYYVSGDWVATGNTYGMANILANLIWPCGNPWFQSKLFLQWPFPKSIRIVSTPTTISETIAPMLKQIFPKGLFNMDRYKFTKDGKHYESHFETTNGWEGDLMTYEQDLEEFESKTLGLVWADEPIPEAIYNACVFRLRMGGKVLLTATPLEGSAWLYDKFLTSSDATYL